MIKSKTDFSEVFTESRNDAISIGKSEIRKGLVFSLQFMNLSGDGIQLLNISGSRITRLMIEGFIIKGRVFRLAMVTINPIVQKGVKNTSKLDL